MSELPTAFAGGAGTFVGRGRELGMLRASVTEALAGRGRLLLLVGEAGIGKTRTAQELAAYGRERGMRILWGRTYEGGGAPPYWPWVQAIRAYVRDGAPEDLRADLGAGAADVAHIVSAVRERLHGLPLPPQELAPDEARFRVFDGVATFLKNAGARQPLFLVLDDLHWADRGSLLLLQFVAREMGETHLVIVGTYRDEEAERSQPLFQTLGELGREAVVRSVVLRGLGREEIARYIELTVGDPPTAAVVEAAFRQTEGNPFFLGEVVRLLIAEGSFADAGSATAKTLSLPPGVRAVISSRLDRVSATCRQLLTLAAAVGEEFGLDVLESVTDTARHEILRVLEEASAARVIAEVSGVRGRYGFTHALVRETIYRELSPTTRVGLHRQIGQALEALHAGNLEPHLTELAHHSFEAALGGVEVAMAIGYATRAADRASVLLAYEEAAGHYARALEMLEQRSSDEAQRCELLLKLGDARWSAGEFDAAREAFQRAAELAEQRGTPEQLARAALGFGGDYSANVGMVEEALDEVLVPLLKKALEALGEHDTALRAKVMGRLAEALIFSPAWEQRVSLARRALEMARRVGDKAALAHVLSTTRFALWGPDGVEEFLPIATEMLHLARETGSTSLMSHGHMMLSTHALMEGDLDTVDREIEACERAAKVLRRPDDLWQAAAARAMRALLDGRLDDVEPLARQALVIGQERNATAAQVFGEHMFLLRMHQGRLGEILSTLEHFAKAQPGARGLGWRCAQAWAYAELRREADTRRELERLAARDFADFPRNFGWLPCLFQLSEVVAFLGDTRRAAVLYTLLLPYARRCVTVADTNAGGSLSRSLGILATTLRRFAEGARHFEDALEMHAKMRARTWLAYTQRDYARMLLARNEAGDREKALALLDQALDTAQTLGMMTLLERALALRAGAQGPHAPHVQTSIATAERQCPDDAVFRREGDYWTIAYRRKAVRLRHTKGLGNISRLLASPGREIHVVDMIALEAPMPEPPSVEQLGRMGLHIGHGSATDDTLDAAARRQYRARLSELHEDLEEAQRCNDLGRVSRARTELDFIAGELGAAYGLNRRARRTGDPAERARKTVTWRIRDGMTRIARAHPELGRHLEHAIRTGSFCAYVPEEATFWLVVTAGAGPSPLASRGDS
jgi:predicted ATPase